MSDRASASHHLSSFAGLLTSVQSPAMRDPRLEKLADVLVNYSVGVKPGQLVRISSPAPALNL